MAYRFGVPLLKIGDSNQEFPFQPQKSGKESIKKLEGLSNENLAIDSNRMLDPIVFHYGTASSQQYITLSSCFT
jgi:hypothetical protein